MFVLPGTVFALVMVNASVTVTKSRSGRTRITGFAPVIRDARELATFGRKHLSKPVSRDFFAKEDHGVYRIFFHFVPVKGRGAVNRRLWSKRLKHVRISRERFKN